MPRAVTALPNDVETITRPVVLDVTRELIRMLRLDDGPVQVVYSGGAETIAQPNSALDADPEAPRFGGNAQLIVEAQERAVEDRVYTMAVHQNEHAPVFHDKALGVRIVPVKAMHEVMLSMTYRAKTRSEAQRFKHDMLMRVAMLRDAHPIQMNYSFTIPYQFLHMLLAVHTLRERQAGYGEDFDHWLSENLDARGTQAVNLAGKRPELMIPEQQIHNWGVFSDFLPAQDQPTNDSNNGTWKINFSYRFQYDKPIGCRAEWPMVVHNQLMFPNWLHEQNASGEQIDPWRQKHHSSRSRHAMDVIAELYARSCVTKYNEVFVPANDEWVAKHLRPDTANMIQLLLQADPENLHDVVNLADMGEYAQIDSDVLEFLKTESRYLNRYCESIVHLSYFENDMPQQDGTLAVSPFLSVTTTNPMDLRKTYHMRVGMISDLYSLRPQALDRLAEGGKGAWKLLIDLQYRFFDDAYIPELIEDKYISNRDIDIIAKRLLGRKRPLRAGREAVMLTVGQYTVLTKRMSDLESDRANNANQTTRPGGESRYLDRCEGQTPCNDC